MSLGMLQACTQPRSRQIQELLSSLPRLNEEDLAELGHGCASLRCSVDS
jgi:hypothetical protein